MPDTILPSLTRASITGVMEMARSNSPPPSISRLTTGPDTNLAMSLWPVSRSNCGASWLITAVIGVAAINLVSAASAIPCTSRIIAAKPVAPITPPTFICSSQKPCTVGDLQIIHPGFSVPEGVRRRSLMSGLVRSSLREPMVFRRTVRY